MIADDEKKIRTGLKTLIHWEELQLELCEECENGDELLSVLSKRYIDIVVTDMQMPGICGVELLKVFSEKWKNKPILVISGYDDFKYVRQAISTHAVDYILKPVDEEELNNALIIAVERAKKYRANIVEKRDTIFSLDRVLVDFFAQIKDIEDELKNTEKNKKIKEVRKYLDESYTEQITLSELENIFYLNKEYLSRAFKNVYNVSIAEYSDHVKILHANDMLIRSESVKEIVYKLAYYDESHFYKKYKKIMGCAPSEYCGN
ncbi:MAG: response regulator [Eubacteriales bacterium]